MKKILLLILVPFILHGQNKKEIFTMFYNVENFFDTINDLTTNDDEFLPFSKKEWNTSKYNQKINKLTKVFSSINNNKQPNIIGLCEVENKDVIQDLLKVSFFKENSYSIIHQNSPDSRGIDCALLFDDNFELINYDFIEIKIPQAKRPTRDIVYAQLKIENEIINIFVNHWPSRWGGQKETDHKRVFTAQVLRKYIDDNINKNEHIIIMGDLNDYPSNESIQDVLINDDLTNLMKSLEGNKKGSYNYKGTWNFIDHIIISNTFLNSNSTLQLNSYNVYKEKWMLYTNKKGEQYPSRTYGGSKWFGGFSDHLPIFCSFTLIQ
ncbi:MAG: endonuclease [Flavobacteriales bacterium]|jgi:predicted extracellular nuclease|nr:endonuclease [Flavobacteriales bacterium]|tara:strand:- start:613 stop:1578 length:966 start_codon:yes stop_codon:yes gene_type:complete